MWSYALAARFAVDFLAAVADLDAATLTVFPTGVRAVVFFAATFLATTRLGFSSTVVWLALK